MNTPGQRHPFTTAFINRSSRAWVHRGERWDGRWRGIRDERREGGEAPDQRRCMRKKAKLRKHLANGDYHTLGLAARRSALFVPSERDCCCCCCSCIAASARIIAKGDRTALFLWCDSPTFRQWIRHWSRHRSIHKNSRAQCADTRRREAYRSIDCVDSRELDPRESARNKLRRASPFPSYPSFLPHDFRGRRGRTRGRSQGKGGD